MPRMHAPFADFAPPIRPATPLRATGRATRATLVRGLRADRKGIDDRRPGAASRGLWRAGFFAQMAAVPATGNFSWIAGMPLPEGLPASVASRFAAAQAVSAALVEAPDDVADTVAAMAARPGAIVTVHAADRTLPLAYQCDWLLEEVSTSINTTAAGGNATLMMIG